MGNKKLDNFNVGDTVLVPYEMLPEPLRGDNKERGGKRAVVYQITRWLLVLKLKPSNQIVSIQHFDCDKVIPLETKQNPKMFDEKKLMDSLRNIK